MGLLARTGPLPQAAGAQLGKLTRYVEWQCRYSTNKQLQREIAFLEERQKAGKLPVVPPALQERPSLGAADFVALKLWLDARRGAAEGFSGASLSWSEIGWWRRQRGLLDDEFALEVVLACEDAAKRGRALAEQDRDKEK